MAFEVGDDWRRTENILEVPPISAKVLAVSGIACTERHKNVRERQ
jgi:hypothetical protein